MKKNHHRVVGALFGLVAALAVGCATSKSTEPRISYVGVLRLQSADPARLARWYQDFFAFPAPETKPDGALAGEMNTSWGPLIYRIDPLPAGAKPVPMDVDFAVNHLEPFVEKLTAAGTPPLRRDQTVEGKQAWFRDPDGNTVLLTERP
jgi:hypothetical protein